MGNLWLLKKLHCKRSIHWVLLKRKTPGSRRTESAVLDWITRPSYVFPLRIQRILWTQFRGSGAFLNVTGAGGDGGGLIVHHAKRIHVPLLKFLRMPFAWLCGTKSCFIACDLNSFRIFHYQMILDIFLSRRKGGKCMSPMACTVNSKFNLIKCWAPVWGAFL